MKAGDSGDAPVTPGNPAASTLFRLITTHDEKKRMPQKDDPLPPAQVAAIERWIRGGAAFDGPDRAAPLTTIVPHTPHPAAPTVYARPVPVLALAFSADGRELVAGGYHEVTVWDPATGKLLRRVGNLPQQVQSIEWSAAGTWMAVAGGTPGTGGEVAVIRLNGSELAAPVVIDRVADMVLSVSVSPDGKHLAAGGADGTVRIYDVASPATASGPPARRSRVIAQHSDWVTAVAFSPDGRRVASASRDKTARVFDAASGEMLSAYFGHDGAVLSVAWDTDGDVLSAGRDREVHSWEPRTDGKRVAAVKGFDGDVLRLVRGGEFLFSAAADGKVRQHKVADRSLVRTFGASPDWVYALAFEGKTGQVAAGSYDGTVKVYELAGGKTVGQFVAAPGFIAAQGAPR
jgi:WD40 repeat protein